MSIIKKINDKLEKTAGVRLKRSGLVRTNKKYEGYKQAFLKRQLKQPVFILSSVRSGSSLLSSIMNAHSKICSPTETHFSKWRTNVQGDRAATRAAKTLGLDNELGKFILWDATLAKILDSSNKEVLVEKTPGNVFECNQIIKCWSDAKFVILERHPVSIAQSWQDGKPDWPKEKTYEHILKYVNAVEEAREKLMGKCIVVKYEDILAEPGETVAKICDFIGLAYEPEMLNYTTGINLDERYRGIGERGNRIRSGKIQKGRKLPKDSEIPNELIDMCVKWGYVK